MKPMKRPALQSRLRSLAAALPFTALLLLATAIVIGCVEGTQSSNEIVRNVAIDFTGVYTGTGNTTNLVTQQSGEPVTFLNLNQTGNQLDAFDNNGRVYRGSISRLDADNVASFSLEGSTTANNRVLLDGSLSGTGTSGTISGTWIEPNIIGILSGEATIADSTPTTNQVSTSITITPSGNQNMAVGQQRSFSASADGTNANDFQWQVSNTAIGRLINTTGQTVSYAATSAGTQTLTVTSGGDSESVSISQSGGTNTGLGTTGANLGNTGVNLGF